MAVRTVSSKGRVVIPAELRRKYHITKGTKLAVVERDGQIVLQPPADQYLRSLQGIMKGSGMLQELMEEKKRSR